MTEGRYNIPKQYKVDKGMPVDAFFQRIDNPKCREIFKSEVESMIWKYQMVDKKGISNIAELIRERGLSVLEISLKSKVLPDLLTEVFADLLQRAMVLVYRCDGEMAMGAYIPMGRGATGRICATDFYDYDEERMIELLDYEQDSDKNTDQIHKRIFAAIRQQRRVVMVDKAFEQLEKAKGRKAEGELLPFEFNVDNLDKIREDADFVRTQLRVV